MTLLVQKMLNLSLEQNTPLCIFKFVHFSFWVKQTGYFELYLHVTLYFMKTMFSGLQKKRGWKTTYLHVELLEFLEIQPPAWAVLEEPFVPLLELMLVKLCALHQVLHHFGGQFAILFPHCA